MGVFILFAGEAFFSRIRFPAMLELTDFLQIFETRVDVVLVFTLLWAVGGVSPVRVDINSTEVTSSSKLSWETGLLNPALCCF